MWSEHIEHRIYWTIVWRKWPVKFLSRSKIRPIPWERSLCWVWPESLSLHFFVLMGLIVWYQTVKSFFRFIHHMCCNVRCDSYCDLGSNSLIGDFRVPKTLTFNRVQFLVKMSFICKGITNHFHINSFALASLWNRGLVQLVNRLFYFPWLPRSVFKCLP